MAQPTEFVRYVCERLAPLGQVSARSMFGGWGLYVDNQFCAIVHRDTRYLKVDDMTRPDFEAKGCAAGTQSSLSRADSRGTFEYAQ
jgi:DNA transformation protein